MRIRRGMHKKDDSDWKRLLAAARAAGRPRNAALRADDRSVREAWERGDRKALSDLASSAPFDRLHPCDVLLLEANLDTDQAVAVLREAQRRRPGDFWLNHALGMRLHGMRPPRFDEAIGYLRTASALRPESPGAILNVGHVLQDGRQDGRGHRRLRAGDPPQAGLCDGLQQSRRGPESTRDGSTRRSARVVRRSASTPTLPRPMATSAGHSRRSANWTRRSPPFAKPCVSSPAARLAARHLAEACYRKVVAGLQSIHKFIDVHIVRLRNQRPFLQTLLDPRSLPMLRRCLAMALAAAALTDVAHAQTGPGTIYYQYGSPDSTYRVAGNGTGNVKIGTYPDPSGKISSLATYPGGRQVQHPATAGTIPGTTMSYTDIILYAEVTGAQTVVTNFRGPEYIEGASRWHVSNDHQDSFFSFTAYDASTGQRTLYRYNLGPLADVFAPGFTPFVSNDSRLTALTTVPDIYTAAGWDGTGTKFFYSIQNPDLSNLLVYGFDTTTGATTLVNDPAVSGVNLAISRCSSTEPRLFGNATDLKKGTKGIASFYIASFYPVTGLFTWVIQEGGKNATRFSNFTVPLVPPDGTVVAFGMLRIVNGKTCPSLVRVPVSGGAYTPLVTFPANSTNTINAGSQAWTW